MRKRSFFMSSRVRAFSSSSRDTSCCESQLHSHKICLRFGCSGIALSLVLAIRLPRYGLAGVSEFGLAARGRALTPPLQLGELSVYPAPESREFRGIVITAAI